MIDYIPYISNNYSFIITLDTFHTIFITYTEDQLNVNEYGLIKEKEILESKPLMYSTCV